MKALLIGYGEVGEGISEAWMDYHDIIIHDPDKGFYGIGAAIDSEVLLVAIPWSDKFTETIDKYKSEFEKSPTVIVFSSVPIGTCRQIPAIHSPIEGDHTNMVRSIQSHKRYMGGYSETAYNFFREANCDVVCLGRPEHTEFLKLRSTTIYGVNIEMARYSKAIADELELSYWNIKDYDEEYNRLVRETDRSDKQRYILDAPEGRIGGHCVIPNAKLLQKDYPNELVEYILWIDGSLKGKEER